MSETSPCLAALCDAGYDKGNIPGCGGITIDYSTKAVLGSTKDGLDRSPKRQSKRKIWLHLVISMNPSRDIVPRTDELRTERYQSLTFHPNYQILRSTSCAI